jgi:hypothetical protein
VLERHWQAIDVKTPADAFCVMASDAATGLDRPPHSPAPVPISDRFGAAGEKAIS